MFGPGRHDAEGGGNLRASRKHRVVPAGPNRWLLARVLPYQSPGHNLHGVVITLINIGEFKSALDDSKRMADDAQAARYYSEPHG